MLTFIRALFVMLFAFTIGGCVYQEVKGGDSGYEEKSEDIGNNGGNTGDSYNDSTWFEIRTGYCYVQRTSDFGATWSDVEIYNVADDYEAVLINGDPGEMLHIYCDASVVPQYQYPQVEFDLSSCPRVYCNPHGGTNREFGEDEDCGNDLEVYVYPEEQWYGDGHSSNQCGPWNLDVN